MAEETSNLIKEYKRFCEFKEQGLKDGKLDLSSETWFFPTTMVPLIAFLNSSNIEVRLPRNDSVRKYFEIMSGRRGSFSKTDKSYMPVVELPEERDQVTLLLERIQKLCNRGKDMGGIDAFAYLLAEMTDNIYEHSQFSKAYIFAQRYATKKFSEIAIFDNGITIEGSYKKAGFDMEDRSAILEALQGISTKDEERGFGLRTSVSLFTKGLKGEFMIVSGSEAVYINKDVQKLYKLDKSLYCQGTLIGVRLPYPSTEVNMYDYIA